MLGERLRASPRYKNSGFEEQFLVYTTLTTACNYLMLTYPMADIEGKALRPSVVISRMKKIFPKLIEESQITESQGAEARIDMIVAPEPTFNHLIGAVEGP